MNPPAVVDPAATNHLGAVIHHIRPDWHPPGIRAALESALGRHPYPLVAAAAINAASDPKATTPGIILARCTNGWITKTEPPTATPTAVANLRCGKCQRWVTEENHQCKPIGDYTAGVAKAKAAMR